MGASLGHAPLKGRGGVMDVPPHLFVAKVAAIASHHLGVKTGAQILGGDGVGDGAAAAMVKDAGPGDAGRFTPETAHSFEVTAELVQLIPLI